MNENTDALREKVARAIAQGMWPGDSWDAEAKDGDLREDDREECRRAADAVLPLLAAERENALREWEPIHQGVLERSIQRLSVPVPREEVWCVECSAWHPRQETENGECHPVSAEEATGECFRCGAPFDIDTYGCTRCRDCPRGLPEDTALAEDGAR